MHYLVSPSTDSFFNIALEEYFLKNFSEDFFILYRNEPSVIVGKHQNTMEEINVGYIINKNIKVVRRMSGGGAVYHDLGNLNFSFILNGVESKLIDFKRYTLPIVDALNNLGVKAKFEGRNDIRVEGKKISGNAEHVYKNRVLHHGTLLFNSNLYFLNEAIRVSPGSYQSTAVKSVRSNVANITEYLTQPLSIEEFIKYLFDFLVNYFPGGKICELSNSDYLFINNLIESKYSQWNWNYGYSPTYTLSKSLKIDSSTYFFSIVVERGVISKINITNDYQDLKKIKELETLLTGKKHNPSQLMEIINPDNLNLYLPGLSLDQLFSLIF